MIIGFNKIYIQRHIDSFIHFSLQPILETPNSHGEKLIENGRREKIEHRVRKTHVSKNRFFRLILSEEGGGVVQTAHLQSGSNSSTDGSLSASGGGTRRRE